MERYISISKRKRISNIQMLLTFMVSGGLLIACPAPEEGTEELATSSVNITLPNGAPYLAVDSEMTSNFVVQEPSLNSEE